MFCGLPQRLVRPFPFPLFSAGDKLERMRSKLLKHLAIKLTVLSAAFLIGVLSSTVLTSKQPSVLPSKQPPAQTAVLKEVAEPKSVLDYYRLLPDKYFEANEEERVKFMLNERRAAVVDVEHGYLHAVGDGAQTDIYVRLFDRPGQLPVMAVKYYASDSQDYTYLDFFEYKDGGLVQVSLSPVEINENLVYELPRYGNTIQVFNKHGAPLYNFVWSQTGFLLRRR